MPVAISCPTHRDPDDYPALQKVMLNSKNDIEWVFIAHDPDTLLFMPYEEAVLWVEEVYGGELTNAFVAGRVDSDFPMSTRRRPYLRGRDGISIKDAKLAIPDASSYSRETTQVIPSSDIDSTNRFYIQFVSKFIDKFGYFGFRGLIYGFTTEELNAECDMLEWAPKYIYDEEASLMRGSIAADPAFFGEESASKLVPYNQILGVSDPDVMVCADISS